MENKLLADRISARYESYTQNGDSSHFDKIGFLNVGYWRNSNDSMEMAQINLVETLIGFFSNTEGRVLDAGCGKGASSKFLTKYFDSKKITGINVSESQLRVCRVVAPECNFKLMDATQLEFENSSIDNILSIEAAFHFLTRQKFFEEAHRVLRPTGRLAMLDVLFDYDRLQDLDPEDAGLCPRENYLPNLDAYRESLLRTGFRHVRVEDCTALTGNAACDYVTRMEERNFGETRDNMALERIRQTKLFYNGACSQWCFVYAIK